MILCSVSRLQENIKMRPPPVVTGISPAEGPPGTKVIIRGEHLGVNAKDVTGTSAVHELTKKPDNYISNEGIFVKMFS